MSNRKEIVNEDLELYKKYTRRIKLTKLYEQLDVTPNDFQYEFIQDYDNDFDKYHTFVLNLGRRSGKSHLVAALIVKELLVPHGSVALVSPTNAINKIIFDSVVNTLKKLGIKPSKINQQSYTLSMDSGSKLISGSVLSSDGFIGNSFSLLITEEASVSGEKLRDTLELQLLPTFTDLGFIPDTEIPYGKLVMLSTPRGKNNYFYEMFMRGKKGEKGYKSYQYPSTVNPLVTQAFLDTMRGKMDELTYLQEYEAKFVDISQDTALHSFNSDKNIFNISEISTFIPELTIISGIDIGFKDASAQVLVAKAKGKYYCFDAEAIAQVDTKTIYDTFYGMERKWNVTPEVRYIDKSAALTAYDLASIYNFTTYPGKNDRKLGIAILNQLFREGNLLIEESLYDLIQEIETLTWNTTGKDFVRAKKGHSDLCHAMRYSIVSDYHQYGISQDIIVL